MGATRSGHRAFDALRPVEVTTGFHRNAEGSVFYRAGGTVVLATASVEDTVPEFMRGRGRGWVTAEYQMHPRANPHRRENRDGRDRPLSGRAREIQRLVGRALRAGVNLDRLGERTVAIDCDVFEADGGTRTASVTAGWIAVALALATLRRRRLLEIPVLRDQIAAASVGHVGDRILLDLDYAEDSTARVDLNLVATDCGSIVEIQGTAEGEAIPRSELESLTDLALKGVAELCRIQRDALVGAGVDLGKVMIPRP
ncbi:MAG: ribonuclease PH [Polyangiaceae bacterium]|nr:ribonuclease PH [Polyangiaceae bacterium]